MKRELKDVVEDRAQEWLADRRVSMKRELKAGVPLKTCQLLTITCINEKRIESLLNQVSNDEPRVDLAYQWKENWKIIQEARDRGAEGLRINEKRIESQRSAGSA